MYRHERDHAKSHLKRKQNQLLNNKIAKILKHGGTVKHLKYRCRDEEHALRIEIALIAKYGRRDNNTGILCNMTDGGDGVKNHTGRMIDQYDLNGQFIKTWKSTIEIANQLTQCSVQGINWCIRGKGASHKGFRWALHGQPLMPIDSVCKNKENSIHFKSPIFQYCGSTGLFLGEHSRITIAARALKISERAIMTACRIGNIRGGGFYWSRIKYDRFVLPTGNHL